MAKISAYGDTEVARWRRPNGAYVVLTHRGRVLRQLIKGDGYTVRAKFSHPPVAPSPEHLAARIAACRCRFAGDGERVAVRNAR